MLNRRISKTCIAASVVLMIAVAAVRSESPATEPSDGTYSSLIRSDGGPPWKLEKIETAIPPATVDVEFARNKPVPPKTDPNVIVKAAFKLLRAGDKPSFEQANKLIKYAANKLASPDAIRFNSLMQFHGIGETVDRSGSMISVGKLMDFNDIDASIYLAKSQPKTFVDECKAIKSIKKILELPAGAAFKTSAQVTNLEGAKFILVGDEKAVVDLKAKVTDLRNDRIIDIAGYVLKDKEPKLVLLAGEVPKPTFKCAAALENPQAVVGGTSQVHSVKIQLQNTSRQYVKNISVKVRCYDPASKYNDYSVEVKIENLAPGAKESRSVDFSMYNYQYIAASSMPRAEVDVTGYDW